MADITFRYEVPFGHRLMFHDGKCKFPHGHNYIFEVALHGTRNELGMIRDFSELKTLVREFFEPFDHAMVLHHIDPLAFFLDALRKVGPIDVTQIKSYADVVKVLGNTPTEGATQLVPSKVVLLDSHPTAENLSLLLCSTLRRDHRITARVTCWEQRDCAATYDGRTDLGTSSIPRIVKTW